MRSRRSISKEDASSLLADSGISLSSPPSSTSHHTLHLDDHVEEVIINKLCLNGDKEENTEIEVISEETAGDVFEVTILPYTGSAEDIHKCKFETFIVPDTPASSVTSSKRARKTYICGNCQKEFGGSSDLKRHLLIHSNERPFRCEHCEKSYRQAINLRNHIKIAHNKEKQFDCTKCSKSFALKERLRLHMRVHSGEKPYACEVCDKRFARGGQLQQHIITHGDSTIKKFPCLICLSNFSTAANLRAHQQRHEQGPVHFCEECHIHFPNEVLLTAHHNKMHLKVKSFDCELCHCTIVDEDLAEHMKTHANHKLHLCEVCNATFTQKSQFNVHMRMHTGERPYQCRICWQTFAHSSVLKLHIRKHTGEKPFQCLLCTNEVAFSQLPHLKTHMKKIHNQNNPYMCEGCHQFFKVKVDLQTHMQQECSNCSTSVDEQNAVNSEQQILSHIRFLMAVLLKKISSEQKLKQLGYEKRLIDNVVIASLKLANRKANEDCNISAIERMKDNVSEFLNWIVPVEVMENFKQEDLTVECILDKIVTMYMKQKA